MYFGQKIESKIRVNLNILRAFYPFFAVPFKVEPKFNSRRRTSSVTTTTFSSPRLQPPSLSQTGPQNCRLDALSPRLLPPAPQHSVSIWRNFFHNHNLLKHYWGKFVFLAYFMLGNSKVEFGISRLKSFVRLLKTVVTNQFLKNHSLSFFSTFFLVLLTMEIFSEKLSNLYTSAFENL